MDALGHHVRGKQKAALEHGGVIADPDLAGRRGRQGPAEPLEKRKFAAQAGLRGRLPSLGGMVPMEAACRA
jgi:hypothetical protein